MEQLKRIIGVYLIAVAVIVAVHTIIEPLYYTSTASDPYTPNWSYINPLMAIAVVLSLVCSYGCKRRADREGGEAPVTRYYLAANTLFYGFVFVGILFFWNWFNYVSPSFTAVGDDTVTLVWGFIDAILPPLLLAMGMCVLKCEK